MNDGPAICPNCNQEVVFARTGSWMRCPECGAAYGGGGDEKGPDTFLSIIKVMAWVMIIMLAILGVGAAVVFIGCAAALSGI